MKLVIVIGDGRERVGELSVGDAPCYALCALSTRGSDRREPFIIFIGSSR